MLNWFFDCPTDCESPILPPLQEQGGCDLFGIYDAQVCGVVFLPNNIKINDWSNPLEWANLVDNQDTTNRKAKYLRVEGGLPAPEKIKADLPRSELTWNRKFSLNSTVKNMLNTHYDFVRNLQCGKTDFTFFYETLGGWLYGDLNGIVPSKVDADLPLENDVNAFEYGNINLNFYAHTNPKRIPSPFADEAFTSQFIINNSVNPVTGEPFEDTNFANTNLTFDTNRIHDLATYNMALIGSGSVNIGDNQGLSKMNLHGGNLEIHGNSGLILHDDLGNRYQLRIKNYGNDLFGTEWKLL